MTSVDDVDSAIIEITPQLAEEMLEGNTRNRTLRQAYVKRLADAMLRGEWRSNGEPIQFARDGTLLNGQHRLYAVAHSKVTVEMLVVRGLPKRAQWTIDTGARRKLSDVLALKGETETTTLAAMLGLLHRYRRRYRLDGAGRTAPTTIEALDLLEREPAVREHLRLARRVQRATGMRMSVTAVFAYLFDEIDPGEGERFFETLMAADAAGPGDPVRALVAILNRNKQEHSYHLSTYALCAMTIKAFNAWRAGDSIKVLAFKPGGATPEAFPTIRSIG